MVATIVSATMTHILYIHRARQPPSLEELLEEQFIFIFHVCMCLMEYGIHWKKGRMGKNRQRWKWQKIRNKLGQQRERYVEIRNTDHLWMGNIIIENIIMENRHYLVLPKLPPRPNQPEKNSPCYRKDKI